MKRPALGGLFLLSIFALCGCASPMSQREATGYAQLSLRRYCIESGPCGPSRFVKAQRLPTGWLLDYESATAVYGVMVHQNGTSQVSVWAKDAAAAPR
jgi:hypothetical protein